MKPHSLAHALAVVSFAAFSLATHAAPPTGHPPVDNASAASRPAATRLTQKGEVLSVIDAPGYTYIEVKQGGKKQWLAAQTVAVKKGDEIRFDDGAVMSNFYSKTLKRTFPKITFVDQVTNDSAASQLAARQLTQMGSVLNVIDAPGYTYIEVKQNGKKQWLAAQTVAVKKGDAIRFDDGAAMGDFYSKSLKRSFPNILFVSQVAVTRK